MEFRIKIDDPDDWEKVAKVAAFAQRCKPADRRYFQSETSSIRFEDGREIVAKHTRGRIEISVPSAD